MFFILFIPPPLYIPLMFHDTNIFQLVHININVKLLIMPYIPSGPSTLITRRRHDILTSHVLRLKNEMSRKHPRPWELKLMYLDSREEMEKRPSVGYTTVEYVQLVEQLVRIPILCKTKKSYNGAAWSDLEFCVKPFINGLYNKHFHDRFGRQHNLPYGVNTNFWQQWNNYCMEAQTDDDGVWDSDHDRDREEMHHAEAILARNEYALFREYLTHTNRQSILCDFETHVIAESDADRWPFLPLFPVEHP